MRSTNKQRGFTLIEIMVVIVIVGIMISVAVLSLNVNRSDRDVTTEAERYIALSRTVQEEALMQGREFGIELLQTGYRFVEFDVLTTQWSEIPGDELLRLRELPEGIEFELYLEDKRVLLDDSPAAFTDPESNPNAGVEIYSPHLLIYSSGDSTPFELHLYRARDDRRLVLRGDALGELDVVAEDGI